ncbi:AMP-binding protein, partial [Paenibacillus dendrobii]
MVRRRATDQPQRQALGFMVNGLEQELTYSELDSRARSMASVLQEMKLEGERALLMYPPGLEYITAFFGCLYAGIIAVPVYPPRLNRSLSRIESIVCNAQATLALTNDRIYQSLQSQLTDSPELRQLKWMTSEDFISGSNPDNWKEMSVGPDSLVFLQYTSGSTSQPKGVRLTNRNLLHNASRIKESFGLTDETKLVLWLPPYHDMGLIGGIIAPIFAGFPSTLMAPVDFLQSPYQWLKAISDKQATVSGGPNFAYDLCVESITDQQMESLDLTSWSLAFNGAEPIRTGTLKRFSDKFSACGFKQSTYYPCYGLAESVLLVTGGEVGKGAVMGQFSKKALGDHRVQVPENPEDCSVLVSSGKNMAGQELRIVHPQSSAICGEDEIGEVWVASSSVADGYWNNQEASEQSFGRTLPNDPCSYLATGDLGFICDGELYITGRKKDLLIIHGINYYPQDIEAAAEQSHPSLRLGHSAAFSVDVNHQEQLVIVHEVERRFRKSLEVSEVADAIRTRIAGDFSLQTYAVILLNPGRIPKTSSGKIQRHLCKKEFLEGTLDAIGDSYISNETTDWTVPDKEELLNLPIEKRVILMESYVGELLANALKIDKARIPKEESISNWGLDSLAALEMVNQVYTDLGASLSVVNLLNGMSLPDLALEISRSLDEQTDPVLPTIQREISVYRPLSYGQKALWFLQQYEPENTAYNISFAFKASEGLNEDVLRQAFQYLVDRHEVLRTVYPVEGKLPVAYVHPERAADFCMIEVSENDRFVLRKLVTEAANEPFHLQDQDVLRIRLYRTPDEGDILLISVHHIATDLWSLVQLMDELDQIYPALCRGEHAKLPVLVGRYGDYVTQHEEMLNSSRGEELAAYWEQQFTSQPHQLTLPLDKSRPKHTTYKGSSYDFEIGKTLTHSLKDMSRTHGVTLYSLLMASFQVLLHHYSGQADIQVGTPTAERYDPKMKETVGYFVNPVVIRGRFEDNPAFAQFLKTIQEQTLGALENQGFPFALLLERLQVAREPGVNPLFQVMFVLEKPQKMDHLSKIILGQSEVNFKLCGLELESFGLEMQTSQFDLTLIIAETEGTLGARMEYNTDLFEPETICTMAESFQALLGEVVAHPECPVSHLSVLSDKIRHQTVTEWNKTGRDYRLDKPLIQWIEEQAERTPDAMAIRFEDLQLTYRELDQEAERLARRLRRLGAGPDGFVGISAERSLDMMVGLLGILKSGAAYVPLDPAYPRERLAFMLEDAGVPILLTQSHLAPELPEHSAHVVLLDGPGEMLEDGEEEAAKRAAGRKDAIYMIYTSGSTGKPKGVINIQEAVVNRLLWMQETFGLTPEDRVMQKTPISFDVSVWELFWPLMTGAGLVLAAPEGHKDPDYLLKLIQKEKITTLHFVPSMLHMFVEQPGVEDLPSLKRIICSGEALPYALQER